MKPYTHLSDKIWAFKFYRLVFSEEIMMCNNYGETFLPRFLSIISVFLTFSAIFKKKKSVHKTWVNDSFICVSLHNFTYPNMSLIINHFKVDFQILNGCF